MSSPPAGNRPIIEMVKVTKVYIPDIMALHDLSLTVAKGEMLFCTGKSGAGKSTLLKLICRLETPTKGLIEVAGRELGKLKPGEVQQLRLQIGVAYQDFKLLQSQTVFRNVAMPLEVAYHPSQKIRERVMRLLETLDLAAKWDKPTGKLSRGEQQRVALARAAANFPVLFLADEPTGNLDQQASRLVMDLFQQLLAEGSTIVVATHDRALFTGTGHRVLNLHQGRLAEDVGPESEAFPLSKNAPPAEANSLAGEPA